MTSPNLRSPFASQSPIPAAGSPTSNPSGQSNGSPLGEIESRDLESNRDVEAARSFDKKRRRSTLFHHQDRPKLSFAERSLRITWAWFPVCMSTGAMASLIKKQPYTFRGLLTIGKIFYMINLVLFCLFLFLIVARFARKPRALSTSLHHPSESFFFGAFWVAAALLINGMQSYGVPSAGPWLVSALRVIFWIYFACATAVAVFQYQVIFHAERLLVSDAMPSWILPAYPFLVTGVVAANIAETQPTHSATQMIVAGIAGQGLGWILAFFIYTVYLTRLINSALPPASTRPGMYISVGPAAYTCAGILSLGKGAKSAIPADFLGVESFPVGDMWFALSVPVALFLWLIAIWFSALSTVSIIRDIKHMKFALQWWAFVFPNAGLALATIQIGNTLDSEGIKIVGSIITVILVPLWLLCAVLHIYSIWNHDLLVPGKDIGVDDVNEMHDVKKKRSEARKKERRERLRQNGRSSPRRMGRVMTWTAMRPGLERPDVPAPANMNEKQE